MNILIGVVWELEKLEVLEKAYNLFEEDKAFSTVLAYNFITYNRIIFKTSYFSPWESCKLGIYVFIKKGNIRKIRKLFKTLNIPCDPYFWRD